MAGRCCALLPISLINWGGVERCSDPAEKHASSDYDRACRTKDYLKLVDVLGSNALVLGDMPLSTGVLTGQAENVFVFYRILFTDSDLEAAEYVKREDYVRDYDAIEKVGFFARNSRYVLFDAAVPGEKIEDVLEFGVTPGEYVIDTYHINRLERVDLIIHRAMKV